MKKHGRLVKKHEAGFPHYWAFLCEGMFIVRKKNRSEKLEMGSTKWKIVSSSLPYSLLPTTCYLIRFPPPSCGRVEVKQAGVVPRLCRRFFLYDIPCFTSHFPRHAEAFAKVEHFLLPFFPFPYYLLLSTVLTSHFTIHTSFPWLPSTFYYLPSTTYPPPASRLPPRPDG